MANQHAGFCKHFICEETLSRGDSPTWDQDNSRIKYTSVADLHTKVSGMCPPQQDQILSFLHMFSPKSTCVRGWQPLQWGLAPPPPPTGNPGSAPACGANFTKLCRRHRETRTTTYIWIPYIINIKDYHRY